MDIYILHIYIYFMAKVEIKCTENGPNMIVVDDKVFAAMCRCGASNIKPYCDGTHAKIGFKAESKEIKVLG
jgi:CDGSH-type Zn-finger protein